MRLIALSDIHGNSIALDAVLADAASWHPDAYWVLGDFAAVGFDPIGSLERVVALPNAAFLRGNTDRCLVTGERPGATLDQVRADPSRLGSFVETAATFAWTAGALALTRWPAWLAELPVELRMTLPDGTRLLGVHASPGLDDGRGVRPIDGPDDLRPLIAGCEADLVLVGHTHWPSDHLVDGVRIVNLGSVSNQPAPDLRASYVRIEADASGYRLEHRRVDYDHAAVIAEVERLRHPGGAFIVAHQRGERPAAWA
jgi:predicted phosphodiesterase